MKPLQFNLKIRIAAALVLFGLLIEWVSLTWYSPMSFIVFVGVGGLAMGAGILFFFYSIVIDPTKPGA